MAISLAGSLSADLGCGARIPGRGVSLDVPAGRQEVGIPLDQERLEAALVYRTGPDQAIKTPDPFNSPGTWQLPPPAVGPSCLTIMCALLTMLRPCVVNKT
jgi:hypothetical protein